MSLALCDNCANNLICKIKRDISLFHENLRNLKTELKKMGIDIDFKIEITFCNYFNPKNEKAVHEARKRLGNKWLFRSNPRLSK